MITILHIEDDPFIARIVRHVLEREGYEVVHAENAQAGLEAAISFQPALVLTDVWLPGGLSGWEVVQELRKNPQFATTPIVALTSQNTVKAQEMAHASGCDAYLAKPFQTRQLIDCVKRLLG